MRNCPACSFSQIDGLRRHSDLCCSAGVLEAAAQTLPPDRFAPFIKALLDQCSARVFGETIALDDVLMSSYITECPGVSESHVAAFRRRLVPQPKTVAELEGYQADKSNAWLRSMEPREQPARLCSHAFVLEPR